MLTIRIRLEYCVRRRNAQFAIRRNVMSVSITRWALFSGFIVSVSWGCGPASDATSDLLIRGGQEVSADDLSTIRRSTVALTTDYIKPGSRDASMLDSGKSF